MCDGLVRWFTRRVPKPVVKGIQGQIKLEGAGFQQYGIKLFARNIGRGHQNVHSFLTMLAMVSPDQNRTPARNAVEYTAMMQVMIYPFISEIMRSNATELEV